MNCFLMNEARLMGHSLEATVKGCDDALHDARRGPVTKGSARPNGRTAAWDARWRDGAIRTGTPR